MRLGQQKKQQKPYRTGCTQPRYGDVRSPSGLGLPGGIPTREEGTTRAEHKHIVSPTLPKERHRKKRKTAPEETATNEPPRKFQFKVLETANSGTAKTVRRAKPS